MYVYFTTVQKKKKSNKDTVPLSIDTQSVRRYECATWRDDLERFSKEGTKGQELGFERWTDLSDDILKCRYTSFLELETEGEFFFSSNIYLILSSN